MHGCPALASDRQLQPLHRTTVSRPATTAIIKRYTPQNKDSLHSIGHAGSHSALCACLFAGPSWPFP